MKPKGLLFEEDYLNLVRELIKFSEHQSPISFLKVSEKEYLHLNEDFYPSILRALKKIREKKEFFDNEQPLWVLMASEHFKKTGKIEITLELEEKERIVALEKIIAKRIYELDVKKDGQAILNSINLSTEKKDKIKKLIADADINIALSNLHEELPNNNDILILLNRFKTIEKENNNGILSSEEYRIQQTILNNDLLKLIE